MFGSILACAFAAATQTVEAKMPTLATIRARFIVYLLLDESSRERNADVKITFQTISFSLNRSHPPARPFGGLPAPDRLIPLVMEFAKSHDMHPLLWAFAAGGKLFAYQSGVLIVGYSYGYFAARDLVRMGARASPSWSSSFCFYWSVLLAADRP